MMLYEDEALGDAVGGVGERARKDEGIKTSVSGS
jgi:hypothetical protein